MAASSKRLTARGVATINNPGWHADGDGLYLNVSKSGSKSWVFLFQGGGGGGERGLGSAGGGGGGRMGAGEPTRRAFERRGTKSARGAETPCRGGRPFRPPRAGAGRH